MRSSFALAVLSLLGGCDLVFRIDHIDPVNADATVPGDIASFDAAPARCDAMFEDRFDDNVPCAPWGIRMVTGIPRMAETELGLEIEPEAGRAASSGGCFGEARYVFGLDGVMVEVDSVVEGNDGEFTSFSLDLNLTLQVSNGNLIFQNNNGSELYTSSVYVPAEMRWWRLRPDGASETVAEYSRDGIAWKPLGSRPLPAPATIAFDLQAGSGPVQTSATGKGVFRHLIVCR